MSNRYDQAEETGRAARRGGIPFARCPFRFDRSREGQEKADRWRNGWNEQDREIRGLPADDAEPVAQG